VLPSRAWEPLWRRMGREILERQAREGWGARVIDRLSADLRRDFPGMTELSARNLKYMRVLAEAHLGSAFVQQVVAQLPWGHGCPAFGERQGHYALRITRGKRSNTVGVATSWCTKLRAIFMSARVKRSRISHGPCQPSCPNSPNNSSRILRSSIF
jgi:hypothetical protein